MTAENSTSPTYSDTSTALKVRYSVRELQEQYDAGNKEPLENLMRAWKGIKELPPEDVKSFFNIGGYHGEPFVGPGSLSNTYWGGYCNHGNVLFPTWHRVYVLKLEQALQSIVPEVTMPYWDETSEASLQRGIPSCLTAEKFELDGTLIDNPLRSFVLPAAVSDSIIADDREYTKPAGYETVRYPLSGLVGTAIARYNSSAHNARFTNHAKNTELLNTNVRTWLRHNNPTSTDPGPTGPGIFADYARCLRAPNYTVFSNTTSAAKWNDDHKKDLSQHAVALEQPHNDVHLAVGGFDLPGPNGGESGQIAGSNGDMGENNTAALDPIFFFHHCNVDRMFWLWQKQNGATDAIEVIAGYPGTSSTDSQGPTPFLPEDAPLNLDTPLQPFMIDDLTDQRIYTSRECVNIEKQLGFTYSLGSLEDPKVAAARAGKPAAKALAVSGINRSLFRGSFRIAAYAKTKSGKTYYLGSHSVLSRWNVTHCANCLTHLGVAAYFPLDGVPEQELDGAEFSLTFDHRGTSLPDGLKYDLEVVG